MIRLGDAARATRDQFIERMFDRGVGVSVHYIPLHRQPYWRDAYRLDPAAFPHSEHVYDRAISLPIYPRMTDGDVETVINAVRASLE